MPVYCCCSTLNIKSFQEDHGCIAGPCGPCYAGLMQMISMQSILRDWFSAASADSQRILLQKVERLLKAKITFSDFLSWFVFQLGVWEGDHF